MAIFKDLSLTLRAHPGTQDILKTVDVDAVKASMKMILLSGPFDSPFDPNFGGFLYDLLFEQLSPPTVAIFKRRVMMVLAEYEPRAVIEDMHIGEDSDNGINFGILFHVIGNKSQQTLNFSLERMR